MRTISQDRGIASMKSVSGASPLLADIGQPLDRLPIGAMHRKVVVAIGLRLFLQMYEIFLSSTISTTLKTQYHLNDATLKLLLASSFLGIFIGAAALGRLATGSDAAGPSCST